MAQFDKEKAILNPAAVFEQPKDILQQAELTHAEKVKVLQNWAYDIGEQQVAEEENMPNYKGGVSAQSADTENENLVEASDNYAETAQKIRFCLKELGEALTEGRGGSSKHGTF
jgi:hypothetical protein